MFWGVLLPLACLVATIVSPNLGWIAWLAYPLQLARLAIKNSGSLKDRARLAGFQLLARFPEGVGLMMFWRDRLLRRRPQLIEHK